MTQPSLVERHTQQLPDHLEYAADWLKHRDQEFSQHIRGINHGENCLQQIGLWAYVKSDDYEAGGRAVPHTLLHYRVRLEQLYGPHVAIRSLNAAGEWVEWLGPEPPDDDEYD